MKMYESNGEEITWEFDSEFNDEDYDRINGLLAFLEYEEGVDYEFNFGRGDDYAESITIICNVMKNDVKLHDIIEPYVPNFQ